MAQTKNQIIKASKHVQIVDTLGSSIFQCFFGNLNLIIYSLIWRYDTRQYWYGTRQCFGKQDSPVMWQFMWQRNFVFTQSWWRSNDFFFMEDLVCLLQFTRQRQLNTISSSWENNCIKNQPIITSRFVRLHFFFSFYLTIK